MNDHCDSSPSYKQKTVSFEPHLLRQSRIDSRLSIEAAAQLASLNKMTLLRYETGDIHTMSLEKLIRLSQIYHTSPALLMGVDPRTEYCAPDAQLLLTPKSAQPPSLIGTRLLACARFLSAKHSAEHTTPQ